MSKFINPNGKFYEKCGTPSYIAPEIILGKGYDGKKADIWSAGILLYTLLYGFVPFRANDLDEIQNSILNEKIVFGEEISPLGIDILSKLLNRDPEKRPCTQQLLQHKWFADCDDSS